VHDVQVVDNKLLVTLEDPEKQNPDLVRSLVEAGADLQFVGELRRTLEDVYLKLVQAPAEKLDE
jgi:ABC-2 type transport system ATP-binding protein